MKPRWPFPPLPAGYLSLRPVVRAAATLLVVGCVVLGVLLFRTSSAITSLGADVQAQTVPQLIEQELALAALMQLIRHGDIVSHAGTAVTRENHVSQAMKIAGSAVFAFDDQLKIRVLNAGSTIRRIGEQLDFAASLESRRLDPVRVQRLRNDALEHWRAMAQILDHDARMLATANRRAASARFAEFETAARRQQATTLQAVGVMLASLLVAGFLVVRLLLAPILRTVRALAALDARRPAPALPSSPLAEIEAIYRTVERHAESLRQADAFAWRSVAVDASANAVVIANAQGVIEYVNPAFTEITGYSAEEAIGQTPRVLKSGVHDKRFYETFWKTILSGREWRGELINRRRDGTLFNDLMAVAPILDERGRVIRFIAIHHDITRRKEVEQQLRTRTDDLQQYRNQREAEDALARAIMDRQLRQDELRGQGVHAWQIPASQFSGDIVAARRAPDGRLFVLLGDATGHGLSAAISLLPLLTRFEDLVGNGAGLRALVAGLDRGMRAMMPIGHFVAAILLCIDHAKGDIEAWLGGMPGLLILHRQANRGVSHLNGSDFALGVGERNDDDFVVERIACPPDSQLALYTDGLVEARNTEGECFTAAMLENLLRKQAADARLAAVRSNFLLHMDGTSPHDDVSFVLVDTDGPSDPVPSP